MNNQSPRRSRPDDSAPVVSFNTADLARINGDISFVLRILADDSVRAFLADPHVRREGKVDALRQIVGPRLHPVVTHFVVGLCSRAGIGVLAPEDVGIDPSDYAFSCVELARLTGCIDKLSQDMVLTDSMLQLGDIKRFLASPVVHAEGKSAALTGILGSRVHPIVIFIVLFLLRMHELGKFSAITRRCMKNVADSSGSLAGEVITAVPVSTDMLREMEVVAAMRFGMPVRLTSRVDTSILGGVLIKAGESVLDGTIDHHLESMRQTLSEAKA